ncbi:DNA-directed RNA polymerase subunit delta [[Eubacterium] hominis]|uniref:DNA-directed RNA polymerase subunit delta n=1 Tax=[Eubacterium] hominis TaxID=2764325 RepID=UPI003A4DF611
MKKAMIDVAYDQLSTKKKPITFLKIWEEVCQIMGFTQAQEEDNIAQFYSDLSLDERFVCVGENKWDLRERHTYHEVVVDTDEILIDEDEEDEADAIEEVPPLKTTEEDY